MVSHVRPEIKVMQNGINKESFVKRQASKIWDLNRSLLGFTTDIIKNSTQTAYNGTKHVSLWCVLKLLNVSKYLEHVTGADVERFEKNSKTKTYKVDENTIKVYGEDVPITEGKVKQMRAAFEGSSKIENNNVVQHHEVTETKITTEIVTEHQATRELQQIVSSLRQILERKAPIADEELNEVIARLNGDRKSVIH